MTIMLLLSDYLSLGYLAVLFIYDALIVEATKNAQADHVLTTNIKDFVRLTPEKPGWVKSLF
jgi:predicted nucleic acid-binding protein